MKKKDKELIEVLVAKVKTLAIMFDMTFDEVIAEACKRFRQRKEIIK